MSAVNVSPATVTLLNQLQNTSPPLFTAALDYLNRYKAVKDALPAASHSVTHAAASTESAKALRPVFGGKYIAAPVQPFPANPGIGGLGAEAGTSAEAGAATATTASTTATDGTTSADSGVLSFLGNLIPQVVQYKDQSNLLQAQVTLAQTGHALPTAGNAVPLTATRSALSSLGVGVGASGLEMLALVGVGLLVGIPLVKKLSGRRARA